MKIGDRIVGSRTLCRLFGVTEKQLHDVPLAQVDERAWFNAVYARMEQEAAAMHQAGRRKRLSDKEVVALWNATVAKIEAEEESIFTCDVTGAELADFLGVTDRWVRQMATDGLLPQNEDGTFPFAHALACYFNFKRDGRR